MCGALMPGHGETITDEAIWERLPVRFLRLAPVAPERSVCGNLFYQQEQEQEQSLLIPNKLG